MSFGGGAGRGPLAMAALLSQKGLQPSTPSPTVVGLVAALQYSLQLCARRSDAAWLSNGAPKLVAMRQFRDY